METGRAASHEFGDVSHARVGLENAFHAVGDTRRGFERGSGRQVEFNGELVALRRREKPLRQARHDEKAQCHREETYAQCQAGAFEASGQ